jgi:hypothetical protein
MSIAVLSVNHGLVVTCLHAGHAQQRSRCECTKPIKTMQRDWRKSCARDGADPTDPSRHSSFAVVLSVLQAPHLQRVSVTSLSSCRMAKRAIRGCNR